MGTDESDAAKKIEDPAIASGFTTERGQLAAIYKEKLCVTGGEKWAVGRGRRLGGS